MTFQPMVASFYVLDNDEFEMLVQEQLGIKDYNVYADNEWGNTTDHVYYGIKDTRDGRRQAEDARLLIREGFSMPSYAAAMLLYALVCSGALPEGDYLLALA